MNTIAEAQKRFSQNESMMNSIEKLGQMNRMVTETPLHRKIVED